MGVTKGLPPKKPSGDFWIPRRPPPPQGSNPKPKHATCSYCGRTRKAKVSNCEGCGASLTS